MFILQHLFWWVAGFVGLGVAIPGIPFLRKLTEGVAYSLSYSAVWGDSALTALVAVATTKAQEMHSGILIYDLWFNVLLVAGFVAAGIYLFFQKDGHSTFVDGMHNIFIIPFVGYLVVISELVLFQSGDVLTYLIGIVAPAVWLSSYYVDVKEKRLNQKAYRQEHGVDAIPGLGWMIDKINALPLPA